MSLSKVADLRELTDEQIDQEIADVKRELFQLRLRRATKASVKPHEFKHARHKLSQLKTIERERQLKSSQSAD